MNKKKDLSKEEQDLRRPLPVEVLLFANQEPIPVKRGKVRAAKVRRVKRYNT